ncbi:hypothetical protein [Escherichia coli]|uniref:hypothetical protein n=1 Tax=Escherichia coli TaxID=562 RepID=UPI001562D060
MKDSPAATAMSNLLEPNQNHDFTAGYGFDRQDRDPTRWTKTLERQNYSVSHNGRWDYGTSELKYYGEKVENKTLATAAR